MMIDVTDASFEADVLQRSMTTPVVVDLWAPWCQPCRTLGPLLEKVIGETNGKVVLAKINVDENMQAATAFRVQSIPAVYALHQGQVVDHFLGAQSEPKIREFVAKLTAGANEGELTALVEAGDEASLRKAVEIDATHKPAAIALARLLIGEDRAAEALEVLKPVESDDEVEALADSARQQALPVADRERIETQLTTLLGEVKGDDDARRRFLELLDELAVGSPQEANQWRKKLTTQLF
jgi:putative thioredoxin